LKLQPSKTMILLLLMAITAALALPAFAENNTTLRHTVYYELDGLISIDREIGDPCSTGASKKQIIEGHGYMTKSESVRIANHIMAIDDEIEWTTAPDAIRNLAVMTTLELCARPMSTAAFSYGEIPINYFIYDKELSLEDEGDLYAPQLKYIDNWNRIYDLYQLTGDKRLKELLSLSFDRENEKLYYREFEYLVNEGDIISPYNPLIQEGLLVARPKTDQVWSVKMETEPGHTSIYEADFIAAYGPGPLDREEIYGKDYMWWFDDLEKGGIGRGDRYVGNYFEIDQYILNPSGETRRYISMSSPFSMTFLEEEMNVEGFTEVKEDFELDNLEAGPDAITLAWYELF